MRYLGQRFSSYLKAYSYALSHVSEAADVFARCEASEEAAFRVGGRICAHYEEGLDDLFGFDADSAPAEYDDVHAAFNNYIDAREELVSALKAYGVNL